MRLHQRQSLHGTRRSGTLQPQRYFARHQLQALLPIARRPGLHALRKNLLQNKVGCSTNLVSLGAQELDLLQVMVPPPLGLRADYYITSNQHTGKTHHKKSKAREIPSNLTSRSSARWTASASRSSDSSKAL